MAAAMLADLLLDAAERHPDGTALITPAGRVTYAELRARALRLAARLVEAGVGPGDRVAIWLPKCAELQISIFGTLLTGACYVPLDYGTPAARTRIIVEDADPKAVVCTDRMATCTFDDLPRPSADDADEPGQNAARRILVCVRAAATSTGSTGASWAGAIPWAQAMTTEPLAGPGGGDPFARAYILYTSGSTGRPKGVVHTHESALTFVRWAAGHLGLDSADVLSQHASPSFDLTVFDFFCSAAVAATLVLVPEWMFGQVGKTSRFIVDKGITVWYSVPSALLRGGGEKFLGMLSESSLRRVVFAGEVIPKNALRTLMRQLPPGCTVSNWYGPTETNVCTFHDVTTSDAESTRPVPIGLPCPYAVIRVDGLDAADQADAGNPRGELLVDSPSVMTGYWGLYELTAQAFVRGDAGRLYKTGDVVEVRDGRLTFLGRNDRLVKVRGNRVQPEEVEAVLRQHENVAEASVVVVREGGVEKLVAAVVTTGAEDEVLDTLMRRCAELFPAYLMPSSVVRLASLPRGDRGKIDLSMLSELLSARSSVRGADRVPAAQERWSRAGSSCGE
jgi:amino acid adenylation domain-containing protein